MSENQGNGNGNGLDRAIENLKMSQAYLACIKMTLWEIGRNELDAEELPDTALGLSCLAREAFNKIQIALYHLAPAGFEMTVDEQKVTVKSF